MELATEQVVTEEVATEEVAMGIEGPAILMEGIRVPIVTLARAMVIFTHIICINPVLIISNVQAISVCLQGSATTSFLSF